MKKSKKAFIGACILFVILLAYASYDISRRTTFPGSKAQLKERIKKNYMEADSVVKDTINEGSKK
jgi:hypothetical protein